VHYNTECERRLLSVAPTYFLQEKNFNQRNKIHESESLLSFDPPGSSGVASPEIWGVAKNLGGGQNV